jgi:peptide/nickel transport system substrate-binding protein
MKSKLIGGLICGIAMAMVLSTGVIVQAGAATGAVKRGGTVNVGLVNILWSNLDPATDTVEATHTEIMDAIYGELFEAGPGGTFSNDLASGFSWSNNHKTFNITIRRGVEFQDGTPFTAAAVAANFNRVLEPQYACLCASSFTLVTGISSVGNKVVVQLSAPYADMEAAINNEAPDWVVDPTAFNTMGEASYAQMPVGAGPFKVVSNIASSKLVLTASSNYWQKGHPYLSGLTFQNIPNDQSTYAALESGTIQVASGITTQSIIDETEGQFQTEVVKQASETDVAFDVLNPPFNDIRAREAIYYATDPQTIVNTLYPGFAKVSGGSEVGPVGLFAEKKVPGYLKYNLAKAKALVAELGGLKFTLQSFNTASTVLLDQALENEWSQAGIDVTIQPEASAIFVAAEAAQKWQAIDTGVGAIYPNVGINGIPRRLGGTSTTSGTHDLNIDGLINQSEQYFNIATRVKTMYKVYAYVAKNAYAVMLYSLPAVLIEAKSMRGTTVPQGSLGGGDFAILWENVYMS